MAVLELHNGYPLWHYIPSMPAAIVFVVVFAITTLLNAWRMFKYRVWFAIPLFIGGICKFATGCTEDTFSLLTSYSRGSGLRWARPGPRQHWRAHAICYPVYPPLARARTLRRYAIHDPQPCNRRHKRSGTLAGPPSMAHKDLCLR